MAVTIGDPPVRVVTQPRPWCPKCGGQMYLRVPRPDSHPDFNEPFWGCAEFPACRGSRNIDHFTGEPESDVDDYYTEHSQKIDGVWRPKEGAG